MELVVNRTKASSRGKYTRVPVLLYPPDEQTKVRGTWDSGSPDRKLHTAEQSLVSSDAWASSHRWINDMDQGIDGGDHSHSPDQNLSSGEMHSRGRDVERQREGERTREAMPWEHPTLTGSGEGFKTSAGTA